MTNAIYKAETGKVFWMMIAGLIIGIIQGIMALVAVAGGVAAIATGGEHGAGTAGGAAIVLVLLALVNIALKVMLYLSYGKLAKDFGDNADGKALGNIKLAALFDLINVGIGLLTILLLPLAIVLGFIALAVSIVAYIFYLIGFSALKNSSTFPGAAGASTVFVAYILILIGAVLGIIPVLNIIGAIVSLVGLIMLLVGWAKIKNAPLPEAA